LKDSHPRLRAFTSNLNCSSRVVSEEGWNHPLPVLAEDLNVLALQEQRSSKLEANLLMFIGYQRSVALLV